MSDPVSVGAAYAIGLGGLALYAASIVRRLGAARRMRAALEDERARDGRDHGAATVPRGGSPVEAER